MIFFLLVNMSSPSSPKNLRDDIKSELEGFNVDNMKKTDTKEKIILPTAEGRRMLFIQRCLHFILPLKIIYSS